MFSGVEVLSGVGVDAAQVAEMVGNCRSVRSINWAMKPKHLGAGEGRCEHHMAITKYRSLVGRFGGLGMFSGCMLTKLLACDLDLVPQSAHENTKRFPSSPCRTASAPQSLMVSGSPVAGALGVSLEESGKRKGEHVLWKYAASNMLRRRRTQFYDLCL